MVRTQIQLTEQQAGAIKKIAASRRQSVAEFIRQAVDNMIKSSARADIIERRKRAMDAVGKFASGKHDVAAKHDTYLTDAFAK